MATSYTLTRGDRTEFLITLTTDGSVAYDLVTQQQLPRMELRRNARDTNALAEFTCSIEPAVADNNVVRVVLGSADSLALPVGTYVSRLLLQHTSDDQLDQITNTEYTFVIVDSATKRV